MSDKMTAETAQVFDSFSTAHVVLLTKAAEDRGCECTPYVDWFTYNRWNAQGFQVQKGEHGIHLTTFITTTKKQDDGTEKVTGKRPKSVVVFCRCQVQPK